MNVDAAAKLDRIYEPQQQRSRDTVERVLQEFVRLLAKKPFEEISMAELAHRARIAVTSIYARFENKQALVLAAHERHRNEMIRNIGRLLDPARWEGESIETVVHAVMDAIIADWRSRLPLLRAALLINDREVYERAAQILRYFSERMAALLSPRLTNISDDEREHRIDFACRAATALLQQQLLFGDVEPGRFHISEAELSRRVADQFLATISAANSPPAKKSHTLQSRGRTKHV
ncbi:MAG: TetR/AcrR family transcriptional regulator [Candidatus Binatus sp.]